MQKSNFFFILLFKFIITCEEGQSSNCKKCNQNLDQCLECQEMLFLYQGNCLFEKPYNSYCYFRNLQCFDEKPSDAYCDDNKNCLQDIRGESCKQYDNTLQMCISCETNDYFFLDINKCFSGRLKNYYCTKFNVCYECKESQNQPCERYFDESISKITKCPKNYYHYHNMSNYLDQLILTYCLPIKLNGYYCDPLTLKCQQCPQESKCIECDSSLVCIKYCPYRQYIKYSCNLCQNGEYFYQNKCYKEVPANTFFMQGMRTFIMCADSSNQPCEKGCYSNLQCIPSDLTKIQFTLNGIQSEYIPTKSFCDLNTQICYPCIKYTCETCDSTLKACSSCKSDQFLFNQDCFVEQPKNTYCQSSKQCQSCADKSGNACEFYCDSELQCILICKENEFEYQGKCVQTKPTNSFCDLNIKKCSDCSNKSCHSCDSTLKKCLTCSSSSQYLFEDQCQIQNPIGTYCKIIQDQDMLYYQCNKCYQSCSDCTGPREEECIQNTTIIYNTTITTQQLEQMTNMASVTSQSTAIASTTMSLVQGVIQSSSCSLLISGFTSQKLTYLLLVKTKLPKSIQSPLETTKEQLPYEQFQIINFFQNMVNENNNYDSFYNQKFKSVNLNFSLFKTSGPGVSIVIICLLLFFLFYFLEDKVNQVKIRQIFRPLYSKLFSGLIIQYIQLSASMFTIGVSSQILEFISQENIQHYAAKILLTIILILVVGLINYKLYFYLNIQKIEQAEQSFEQITREKAQNETIQESKLRRNFMMIFFITQSILQPTIFILLNQNYIIICVIILIMQTGYIAFILILMPFYSKIKNIYFLIDSIAWLVLYIEFLIINILSTKENIESYASEIDNVCWIFIVTVQIILLLNPIYLLVILTIKIVEIVRQRLQSKKQNSSFLLKSQEKLEIPNIQYDQIGRKLYYFQKVELSSFTENTQKENICIKSKKFNKFTGNYQKSYQSQPFP